VIVTPNIGAARIMSRAKRIKQAADAQAQARQAFSERMYSALKRLEFGLGRDVTQGQLAEMVSAHLGESKAKDQTTVGRWFRGTIPDVHIIEAIAEVCGVEPGWLAFGRGPMARQGSEENPAGGPVDVSLLTPWEPPKQRGQKGGK